jgi:hypothetical protein
VLQQTGAAAGASRPATAEHEPGWWGPLERAHDLLLRGARALSAETEPPFDLAPVADAAARALVAVYDAFDGRTDPLEGVRRAVAETSAAAAALGASDASILSGVLGGARRSFESAAGPLGEAEARLRESPPRPRPAAGDLRASIDLPRLHEVERASLAPRIRIAAVAPPPPAPPAPLPRPQSFDELRATVVELQRRAEAALRPLFEPRAATQPERPRAPAPPAHPGPGFAAELPLRLDEADFVRARARDMLEEIALVGVQRTPLPGEPWRSALVLEQRMLRAIDALAALGARGLGRIEEIALDAPVKDGPRLFALTMALGCIRGRDALGVVERILADYETVDATVGDALATALKLVPHDLAEHLMRAWTTSTDPRKRAVATDVLAHRGLMSDAALATAAADVPAVAALALSHLAVRRPGALDGIVEGALAHDDVALRRAAWLALALAAHRAFSRTLSDALGGPHREDAALLLAFAGDDRDAQRLADLVTAAPTPGLVTALGWAGPGGAVGTLVALLERDDEALSDAAARALERITGAGLTEQAALPAEEIEVPEPPVPPGLFEPPRLARSVSDPRDQPPAPANETIERPSRDPERWRAWWREHAEAFSSQRRYRAGRAYTPAVSLAELDRAPCTPEERRWLGRELVVRTGAFVRFDPADLVVVQEQALRSWQPIAERASAQPGLWVRPLPR